MINEHLLINYLYVLYKLTSSLKRCSTHSLNTLTFQSCAMGTAKSPGSMVSNFAGRVWRTRSLSVPLREVQSYFPGWGLLFTIWLSPSTRCQMVNVTLQDYTACSSWRMWLLVFPWCCSSSWSLLAARLMKFRMSTSVTRSKRCSSSTTTFVSSKLRSGGWMMPRCWWQGLLAKCDFSCMLTMT